MKELKTIDDVVNYIGEDDALVVRNIEDKNKDKHWVENWYKGKNGKPEIVEISEELYFYCFTSDYFESARDIQDKENEFYLRCIKFYD